MVRSERARARVALRSTRCCAALVQTQFENVPLARERAADHRDIVLWLPDSLVCIDEHSGKSWQFDYDFEIDGTSTKDCGAPNTKGSSAEPAPDSCACVCVVCVCCCCYACACANAYALCSSSLVLHESAFSKLVEQKSAHSSTICLCHTHHTKCRTTRPEP
eukprot:SAG11_NODE_10744_length_808_cov_1.066291_1_plen_162_part_00